MPILCSMHSKKGESKWNRIFKVSSLFFIRIFHIYVFVLYYSIFCSLIGYKFEKDGKLEEQELYVKRLFGLQRLYSAVLITKLKRNQQHLEHPHSLENGWIWITNFLVLDPLPGISTSLLLEFIQMCGLEMWQVYKKQFMKLLIVLHNQYLVKLEKVWISDFACSNWFHFAFIEHHRSRFLGWWRLLVFAAQRLDYRYHKWK